MLDHELAAVYLCVSFFVVSEIQLNPSVRVNVHVRTLPPELS